MGNKNNKVQKKEKKEILIQNPNKASTIKCFTYLPLKECCSLSILSTEFYKICHSEDMYQEMIIVYKLKVDDSLPTYKEQFHKVMKIKSKPYYVKQKIEVFPIVKNVVESIVHGKIKETLTFVPVAKGIETHLNLIKSFDGVGDGIFKIYKGIHKDLDEMVYMCTPFHNNYKTFYKNQNQLRHKKFRFDHDGNETKLKLSFYSGLAITSRLTNEIYNSKEVCSNIKMENLKIELLEYVASNEDQLKPISDFLTTPQMGLWKVSNKDQKVLVLAFRGSTCEKSNMTDWFIDGSTTPMTVDFMENKVKVHSGFYGFLRRNSDYILKKTLLHLEHEGNPLLVLTGHSLGGAYAQCFAMFKEIAPLKKKIVTYGAPLILQDDPKKIEQISKDVVHVVHEYDVVPRLLGQKKFNYWTKELSDYNHFGMYFWLKKGKLKYIPDKNIPSSGLLSHDLAKVFTTFSDHAMLLYCKKVENCHEEAEKEREGNVTLNIENKSVKDDNKERNNDLKELLDNNQISIEEYDEKKKLLEKVEKDLLIEEHFELEKKNENKEEKIEIKEEKL